MEVRTRLTVGPTSRAFNHFHTQSALQLEQGKELERRDYEHEPITEDALVISPYIDEPHLLDLGTLEPQSRLLAIALTNLQSLRDDYATAPYPEIFNWSAVLDILRQLILATRHRWVEQEFYIVVFRSRIPPTTDYTQLSGLDKGAHAEAMKSGGFLKYWFGVPDRQGRNLATCIWRSIEDAKVGGGGEAHRRAAAAARHMYTEWKIERLGLVIKDRAVRWDIKNWV